MLRNQLITPEGTKDYLFEEAAARRCVEGKLRALFESRGFCEVVTPGLEFLDVFSVRGHSLPMEDMYKLTDHKGRLMALRPDSTLPIARLCATRLKGAGFPIRLFYNQPVYSAARSLRGRSDEVMQTGVELIGNSSKKADLELVSLAVNSLQSCGGSDFRLEIGHIGVLNALLESLSSDEGVREEIRRLIESKNYPALNDALDRLGGGEEAEILKLLPRLFGGEEVIKKAISLIQNSKALAALNYLQALYQDLGSLGLSGKVTVDLGIANRADYYTGIVFKGYMEGHGEAVLSGGRYDNLLGAFGVEAGATGFGINVDAAARMLLSSGVSLLKPPDVLVFAESGYETKAIGRLAEHSTAGNKAELSLFETLRESLIDAKRRGITRVESVGEVIKSIPQKAGGRE